MLIKHEAKPSALFRGRAQSAFYRVKQEQGNACTYFKEFPDKSMFASSLLL